MLKKLMPLLALLLVACGGDKNSSNNTNEVKESKNASYKIVYLTPQYQKYVNSVKADYQNKRKIFDEILLDPLVNGDFAKCEYLDMFRFGYSYFVPDTVGIQSIINSINKNKAEIDEAIHKAVTESQAYIKTDSVTFYIQPPNIANSDILMRMGGVSGMTVGKKHILFSVDPAVANWKESLEHAAAGECYSSYWTNKNFDSTFKWTMLRYMVWTGKANAFQKMVYPSASMPWTAALDEPKKAEMWAKIKPKLGTRNFFFMSEVMFGSNNYPLWTGFTLGYSIVNDALTKNPNMKFEEWDKLDAEKFMELSGWDKK
jgi:uncharacterized protein YjaZ